MTHVAPAQVSLAAGNVDSEAPQLGAVLAITVFPHRSVLLCSYFRATYHEVLLRLPHEKSVICEVDSTGKLCADSKVRRG